MNLAFAGWWYDKECGDVGGHQNDDRGPCLSCSSCVPGSVVFTRLISLNLPRLLQGRDVLPHFTDEEMEALRMKACSHPVAAFRLGLRGL